MCFPGWLISGSRLWDFSFPAFKFAIMKMKVEWIFPKVTKPSQELLRENQGLGSEIKADQNLPGYSSEHLLVMYNKPGTQGIALRSFYCHNLVT